MDSYKQINFIIQPGGKLSGRVRVPGDKSISHRYALIGAIAEGDTRISNYSTGADCHSTLGCVRALGIDHAQSIRQRLADL